MSNATLVNFWEELEREREENIDLISHSAAAAAAAIAFNNGATGSLFSSIFIEIEGERKKRRDEGGEGR